jgi:putative Mn2+ efflux pump MntP
MRKENFYQGIKTVGFFTFIPFILAAGPLTGYFTGDFLQKKFNLSSSVVFIGVGLGFLAAITEVIKILKAIVKVNKS